MNGSWRTKIIVAVFLGILVLGGKLTLGFFGSVSGGKEKVYAAKKQDLMAKVTVAGVIIPNRRTLFTPPYSGYIRKIFVGLGEEVKEGTPILSLTSTMRGLAEENFPMRAPFPGRVVQVLKTEGEYVETAKEGNGILRIDDVTHLFIDCDVAENDVVRLKLGQDVIIKANPILDRTYKGVIRQIALAAREKKDGGWGRSGDKVDFDVRIEVTDLDGRLRPGMSAIVDIVTDNKVAVLALPHEYVQRADEKYLVTLLGGEKREVQIGAQNEELIEIKTGLKEGEEVRIVDFFSLARGK
jgi:biotin carboxyl carrier protein